MATIYSYLVNANGYTPATVGKKFTFGEPQYEVGDTAVATLGDAIGYQANTAVFSGEYSYGNNAVITGAGSVMDITAGVLTVSGSDPYTADVTGYANTSVTFTADKKVTNKGTLNLIGHYTPATTGAEAVTNWVTFTNDSFINNENAIVNLTYAKFLSNNAQAQVSVTNGGTFNITNSVVKAHFAGGEINIQGTFDANTKITGDAAISATKTLTLNGATLEGGSLSAASINLTNSTLTINGAATHSWIYASGTNTIKATAVGEGSKYVTLYKDAILQDSVYAGKVRANSQVLNNESVYLYGANEFATLSTNRAIVKIGDASNKTTVKVGQLDFERYKLADDSYEFGKVDVDFRSTLTVTAKVTKYNGCNLNISIDGLGTTGNDNALYKVVDITGATKVSPLINILTVGGNVLADGAAVGDTGYYLATIGDTGVYLTTETQTTIFVDAAYTADKTGTLVNGHLVGYNAFDTLDAALKEAAKAKSTTITIQNAIAPETAVAETVTANFTESLTLGGAKSATITFSGKNDLILSMAAEKTFTLAADTTLKTLGYDGYIVLSGAGSYDIFGTVDSVSQVAFWGDATVESTGKIVSKYTRPNTGMVLFRSAKNGSEGVTITGAKNQTTKLVQVDTSVAFLVDGKLSTRDTAINATLVDFTQNLNEVGDPMWASEVIDTTGTTPVAKLGAKFVLDSKDTDWTIGTLDASGEKAKIAGEFKFSDGTVDVAGNADLGATITLSLTDDAEMTVGGTLTNRYGTINVGNAADTDKGIAPSSATLSATIIDNYGKINVYNSAISTAVSDNFRNYVANSELNLHKSTFTGSAITNGGKVVVDDSSVQVRYLNAGTNFTVEGTSTLKSTIKATGSITLADRATLVGTDLVSSAAFSLSIAEDSTFTFAGENTISVENSTLINDGTLIVSEKAAVGTQGEEGYQAAVPGALTVGTIENAGTITVNAGSSISAKSIAGGTIELVADKTVIGADAATLIVTADLSTSHDTGITVNGVAAFADAAAREAFYGAEKASVAVAASGDKGAFTLLKDGNTYSLIQTPTQETLYVGTADDLAGHPNYIIGYNAFTSLVDALEIASGRADATTITVLSDITDNTNTGNLFFKDGDGNLIYFAGNVTINGKPVVVDNTTRNPIVTLTLSNNDYECDPTPANGKAIVFSAGDTTPGAIGTVGVDLVMTNGSLWPIEHRAANTTATFTVSSNITAPLFVFKDGTVNVTSTGSLTSAGNIMFYRKDLNMTITGKGGVLSESYAPEEYQIDAAILTFRKGTVNTTGSKITAQNLSVTDDNGEGGGDKETYKTEGDIVLNSSNTDWTITGNAFVRFYDNLSNNLTFSVTFNFEEGSRFGIGGNFINEAHAVNSVDIAPEIPAGNKDEGLFKTVTGYDAPAIDINLDDSKLEIGSRNAQQEIVAGTGDFTNAGVVKAVNNSFITVLGTFTNAGSLTLGNAAVADDPDTTNVDETVAATKGTLTAATINNAGTIEANAGSLVKATSTATDFVLKNAKGGTINAYGSTIQSANGLQNWGTMLVSGTNASLSVGGSLYNGNNNAEQGLDAVLTVENGASLTGAVFNYRRMNLTNAQVGPATGTGRVFNNNGTLNAVNTNFNVGALNNKNWFNFNQDSAATYTAKNTINATAIDNTVSFKAAYADVTAGGITNSGTFELANASVTASSVSVTGENAKFNVSGDATLNFALSGQVTVKDNAVFTKSNITDDADGKLFIAANKTATFKDVTDGETTIGNTVSVDIVNDGTISVGSIEAAAGTLNAGNISGTGTILIDATDTFKAASITGGTITIDHTKDFVDTTKSSYTLIDTTAGLNANVQIKLDNGAATQNLVTNDLVTLGTTEYQVVRDGNDFILNKVTGLSKATILVTSDATLPDGYLLNYNAFTNLAGALKAADNTTTTITIDDNAVVGADVDATMTVEFGANVTVGGGNSATINFTGNKDLIFQQSAGVFTLAENTTIATTGYDGYIVLSGAGSYDIFGTVDSVSQVAFWGDATVESTGKIVSKYTRPNTGMVLFRSAKNGSEGVTITGAKNQTTKLVQVDTSVAFLVDGKLSTRDTAINATLVDFTQNLNEVGDPMWASEVIDTTGTTPVAKLGAKFVLDSKDTDWTIGTLDASGEKAKIAGEFKFSDGTVDVAGNADLGATITLSLTDGAEMSVAEKIDNAGTIEAYSGSTIETKLIRNSKAITLDGENTLLSVTGVDGANGALENTKDGVITLQNGAKLSAPNTSANWGTINVLTNATLDGYFNVVGEVKVNGGVLNGTIDTVTVSGVTGKVTVSGESTLVVTNLGVITLAGATLSGANVAGNGTTVVSGASSSTFTGTNTFGNFTVADALTINAATENCLVVNGNFTNEGTITINSTIAFGEKETLKQIIKVADTGAVVNTGSFIVADGYQVIVQNDLSQGSKGVYLYKGPSVAKTTIVVDGTLGSDIKIGDEVTFGGEKYVFGITAFKTADEIANLTAETTALKFKTSSNSYGNLNLARTGVTEETAPITVYVTKTDGTGTGNMAKFGATTITTDVDFKAQNLQFEDGLTISDSTVNFAEDTASVSVNTSLSITDAFVDFEGTTTINGDVTITDTDSENPRKKARVNFGEETKTNTTSISGNLTVKDADVDFDDATTIGGNVVINGKSEIEFDRDTTISGKLTLDAGSVVEADQGYRFTAGSSVINGVFYATNKDDKNQSGNTDVNLGTVSGSGTIYTDVQSDLTFSTNSSFEGTLSIDVTGLTIGDNKNIKARNVSPYRFGSVVVTGDGVDEGTDYKKYFAYSRTDGFTQRDGACNVYLAETDGDIVTATSHNWTVDSIVYRPDVIIVSGSVFENATYFTGANGDSDVRVEAGTFNKIAFGGEKVLLEDEEPDEIIWTRSTGLNLTIENGNFTKNLLGGDNIKQGGVYRRKGDSNLTIKNGTFGNDVAAGLVFNPTSDHMADDAMITVENTNLTISGGVFNGFVYGGNYAINKSVSNTLTVKGDSTVTLIAGNAIEFKKSLFVGSYGYGKVKGNTELVITGKGTITVDGKIWGGCSGDFVSEGINNAYISPSMGDYNQKRNLTFTGFDGTVACDNIRAFSNVNVLNKEVEIDDESAIVTTYATLSDKVDLSDVSNWTFDFGSTLSGAFKNDFSKNAQPKEVGGEKVYSGDTLALNNLADANWAAYKDGWVLFDFISDSAAATLGGIEEITSDIEGLAFEWNKVDAWIATKGDDSYSLSIAKITKDEVTRNAMVLAHSLIEA